ncbi:hypothetical protein JCM24511_01330 [Saitozyma sp. JCM 24511]|nr:hypothetical protein JCM24511_01330 [Saitozyma sp. JCM 24511]
MAAVSRVLRNAAGQAGKSAPMSADSSLYHFEPQGFWKKFLNPAISSGLPIPEKNRYPQPASRPEKYATPATKASDVAFNPYYKRDTRRAYPQTSVVTQSELSSLLLASPSLASLPAPSTKPAVPENSSSIAPSTASPDEAVSVVAASDVPSLATVLEKLPAGKAFLGGGIQTAQVGQGLPPTPPTVGAKWVPRPGQEIPSNPDAYFPMVGYN